MRHMDKVRCQLFLDAPLAERLERRAVASGSSRSALLAHALEAWLARQEAGEREDGLARRFERLGTETARLRRDLQCLLQSLSLFAYHQFCLTARTPEPDAQARAVGRDRFHAYRDQVERQLARGQDDVGPSDGSDA